MKKVLLLTTVMMFAASLAFGQAGVLGMYSDQGGTDCVLSDAVPGLYTTYVVHTLTGGATASQWAAPNPSCLLATFLSDANLFPVTVGGSQGGAAVGYGACLAAPIAVMGLNFFAQALTPPCCVHPVVPDPNVPSGQVEVVDCGGNVIFGSGTEGVWNADSSCDCSVPTEDTTWGGIKSMYN